MIKDGLRQKQYPLFVAEGTSEKKLDQIRRNGYLSYCLDKLTRTKSPFVVFGHALGPTDNHICNAIVEADELPKLYVGLHGRLDDDANLKTRASCEAMQSRRNRLVGRSSRAVSLEIVFYDAGTAPVWSASGVAVASEIQ